MQDKNFLKNEYYLRINPFFDTSYGPEFVDRKEVRQELYRILSNFIDTNSPQMLFITGTYGVGKTFTLLEIEKDIKRKSSKYIKAENILTSYIRMTPSKPPSDYLLYVYTEIIKALGFNIFKELFDKFQKISDSNNKLVSDLSIDFRGAFSLLGSEFRNIAWDYLRGESVSQSQMKIIGVSHRIDSGDVAMTILMDILKLMKILDYKALIILVDEFENIFTLAGQRKTAQILVTFRDIYDQVNKELYDNNSISKPIIIFASSSSVNQDVRNLIKDLGAPGLQPFVDRLVQMPFDLKPFDKKYVRELIKIKLDNCRIHEKNIGDKDIFPFKEDFIDYIYEVTGGNPRYVLQYTATILEVASEKELKFIGSKEAKEIVAEKNIG